MNILLAMDIVDNSYSSSLGLISVIGFVAAIGLGSIAWYNSKRPKGWEGKERPEIVPEIEK